MNYCSDCSARTNNTWKRTIIEECVVKGIAEPAEEANDLTVDHYPDGHDCKDHVQVLLDPASWIEPKIDSLPISVLALLRFVSNHDNWPLLHDWMCEYSVEDVHDW